MVHVVMLMPSGAVLGKIETDSPVDQNSKFKLKSGIRPDANSHANRGLAQVVGGHDRGEPSLAIEKSLRPRSVSKPVCNAAGDKTRSQRNGFDG